MILRTAHLPGVDVRYRASGDPAHPPVVLLHGGASDGSTWDRLAPTLHAMGRYVIAPDLRGHGGTSHVADYAMGSFVDDLLGLLDALDLPRVTVIAHSLGAHVAVLAAMRAPERFAQLVLEDPPAPPRAAMRSTLPPLGAFAVIGLGSIVRRRPFHARAMTQVIAQLRTPSEAYWEGLANVTARTLVIGGGPKSHVAAADVTAIARGIAGAELTTIAVGHRVHSLAPEAFREAVTSFLEPQLAARAS